MGISSRNIRRAVRGAAGSADILRNKRERRMTRRLGATEPSLNSCTGLDALCIHRAQTAK